MATAATRAKSGQRSQRSSSSSAAAADASTELLAPWTTRITTTAVSMTRENCLLPHPVLPIDPSLLDLTSIEMDHKALETFECPSFDEANAVDLSDALSSWEVEVTQDTTTSTSESASYVYETSFQSLLSSDIVFLPPVQLSQDDNDPEEEEQHQDAEEEEAPLDVSDPRNRCSYRKGKCDLPRTRKKNGSLHTYCVYHRFRSIENQKNFDAKRRKSAGKRPRYHRKSTDDGEEESSSGSTSALEALETATASHQQEADAVGSYEDVLLQETQISQSERTAPSPGKMKRETSPMDEIRTSVIV